MEAQLPAVIEYVQSSRHEHPEADAVAMHPDTLLRTKQYLEEHFNMVAEDPFSGLVMKGEDGIPERGPRICGWTVLKSRDIPEGEVRFVQYVSTNRET